MSKVRTLVFILFLFPIYIHASSPVVFTDVWNTGAKGYPYLGLRPSLAKKGIYFLSNFTFDYNWPARGGIQTRSFPLHQYLFQFEYGMDLYQLMGWSGARIYTDFQYHQTQAPSLKYVGDWQGFDNMQARNLTQLAQLWFEQKLFNQKLAIKLGKIDAYTIFNYCPYAQFLLNNSFTQIPTIIAFPTYPDPSTGVIIEFHPFKWLSLRTSIFDGSQALGVNTGSMGPRGFFVNLGQHANLMNEIQIRWATLQDNYKGFVGLGFWGLTATLPNFKGGTVHGTTGSYLYLNQSLWKEDFFSKKRDREHLRELGAFFQWGVCGKEVYEVKEYFGYGATFHNLTKQLEDTVSIGAATVLFSNATGASYPKQFEMSIDCTYQLYLFDHFLVQPDFQYIIHPGGQGLRNAIVVTLRLMASI